MTAADAARESSRQPSGQFGVQHRPLPELTLVRPDPDRPAMCGNCGGTIRDGYCSECDRRGDWVADSCDDCGRDLEGKETASAFCDACAENVGNDGLTHRQRDAYAREYNAGPGSKALTDRERTLIEARLYGERC